MKLLNVLPLLAVASCLPIYANIRIVKINSDGDAIVKDYENVNLDGVDSLEQLNIAPEFKHLDGTNSHGVEPKKHHGMDMKKYHGMGMKKKPCHGSRFKQNQNSDDDGIVVGPFKSYDEMKDFTDTLVHDGAKTQDAKPSYWVTDSEYVQSTKDWANDLVQDVKDIDFKESFKNIINDNDALFAVMAGAMCGLSVFGIIYLVYLRKLSFESFEDAPDFDQTLPLYEEKESSVDK